MRRRNRLKKGQITMENMTGVDNSPKTENMEIAQAPATLMNLGRYADGDLITKRELCRAFGCSERTLQRMVERFEIPPPMTLAGRKVWIVGKIRAWLVAAAERREAEALKDAWRLNVFTV
jgi:predicted DNA-binding transcriptional regulator AlpA